MWSLVIKEDKFLYFGHNTGSLKLSPFCAGIDNSQFATKMAHEGFLIYSQSKLAILLLFDKYSVFFSIVLVETST